MRILVTAGPTQEPIDPVRYLSNRSSGRMGYAVARAACGRGHDVRLVSGPVTLAPPEGVAVTRVRTAEEMLAAVREQVPWCEALVMAAAVADWRPAQAAERKIKKTRDRLTLELVRTPDVLAEVRPLKGARTYVGFAAETHDVLAEARRKLADKGLDLIVANDVTQPGAGFEVETNRVTLVCAAGDPLDLPLMSKADVAVRIVDWIERFRAAGFAS